MTTAPDKVREAFEKWATAEDFDMRHSLDKFYSHPDTAIAWAGFRAAHELYTRTPELHHIGVIERSPADGAVRVAGRGLEVSEKVMREAAQFISRANRHTPYCFDAGCNCEWAHLVNKIDAALPIPPPPKEPT